MNILAFDTSLAACSAAVARGLASGGPSAGSMSADAVHGEFEPMASGHAERLPQMISAVMAAAGLVFSDLDRIAVTNGPGSFTGTRIAVAAARALALSFPRTEVVVLSSLAVMAASIAGSRPTDAAGACVPVISEAEFLIAVDARRGEVYVQHFAEGGVTAVTEPMLLPVSQAAALGGAGRLVVAGSGARAVAEAARLAGRDAEACLPGLLPDARAMCGLASVTEPVRGAIKPLYLRPADAKAQTGKSIERVAS